MVKNIVFSLPGGASAAAAPRPRPLSLDISTKLFEEEKEDDGSCNSAVEKRRHLGHRAGRVLCTPDHLLLPVHCLIKHTAQEGLFLETCPRGGTLSMNILPAAAKWTSVHVSVLLFRACALG